MSLFQIIYTAVLVGIGICFLIAGIREQLGMRVPSMRIPMAILAIVLLVIAYGQIVELGPMKPRVLHGVKIKDGKIQKIQSQGESEIQRAVIRFRDANKHLKPFAGLGLLFHIPNGGWRSKATAGRLKAEGVAPGVPDLFLPVPRTGWNGLFLEMKTPKGTLSNHQKQWCETLLLQNYAVRVCRSSDEAIITIVDYLQGKMPRGT